jgi:hypothetical protein
MWAIVWDFARADRFYLKAEELHAELSAELVEVVLRYWDDEKPDDEMKRILIQSLRNRALDLVNKEFNTHRRAEGTMVSLDDAIEPGEDVTVFERVGIEDAYFDMEGFLGRLSSDGYWLVMEALEPSERMLEIIKLTEMRKRHISSKGLWCISVTGRMLRRALGWDIARFENAWEEVQDALNEM